MNAYLITDPKYYSNDLKKFESILVTAISNHSVDMICFRDKTSTNFEQLAYCFANIVKQYNIKSFINQNITLASKLNLDGVHLTSTQFNKIEEAKSLGLKVIISCHNEQDIQKAIQKQADMITYSPIFTTPNKGTPKGINMLQSITFKYDIPIIALGGIVTPQHIKQIEQTNAYGFASIRYFINI